MKSINVDRFSQLHFHRGPVLRNRLVVPPMASQTATEAGDVTDVTLAHYARLAEAKPGLLLVEYTFVHRSGRSEDAQLGIDNDAQIGGLAKLATVIRQTGAVAGIQITHAGGKTERALSDGALMGASDIRVPVKDRELDVPTAMSRDEIELWKKSFIEASDRAVKAGFQLIEFHSAHGYGLNQWLSPITNQRTDEYGGSLENRFRLLGEIVSCVRLRHPEILISVRMPGQDFMDGGLSVNDTATIAKRLEKIGVDVLHVSSGIGGWRRPAPRVGEGYLVAEAAQIQAVVGVPVIGVGGIESGDFVDKNLREGRFSLAAVGRAILKGPREWADREMTVPFVQCLQA